MNTDKINRLEQLELLFDSELYDMKGIELSELVTLLRERRNDLLDTIEQLRDQIYAEDEEEGDTTSSNDIESEQYNEDYINRKDDLD